MEHLTPASSPSAKETPVSPGSPDSVLTTKLETADLYGEKFIALRVNLGDTHPRTLVELNNRATWLLANGEARGAALLLNEAIRDKRGTLGVHKSTATSLSNLGKVYRLVGKKKKALPYLAEALDMRKDVLGKKHRDTLRSMNHLGSCFYAQQDYVAAEKVWTEAHSLSLQALGDHDPVTLTAMDNLGVVLHAKGDVAAAEPLLRQAVALSREVLGEAHLETLISMSNLSLVLSAMARGEGKPIVDPVSGETVVRPEEEKAALEKEAAALYTESTNGFNRKRAKLGSNHPCATARLNPEPEPEPNPSPNPSPTRARA